MQLVARTHAQTRTLTHSGFRLGNRPPGQVLLGFAGSRGLGAPPPRDHETQDSIGEGTLACGLHAP